MAAMVVVAWVTDDPAADATMTMAVHHKYQSWQPRTNFVVFNPAAAAAADDVAINTRLRQGIFVDGWIIVGGSSRL